MASNRIAVANLVGRVRMILTLDRESGLRRSLSWSAMGL